MSIIDKNSPARRDILYLSYDIGPHLAHMPWLKIVNAELMPCFPSQSNLAKLIIVIIRILYKLRHKYSIAIAEGLGPLAIGYLLKKLGFINKLIFIALSPGIVVKQRLMRLLLSAVDGVIAVSTLVASTFAKLFDYKGPIAVAHPIPDLTKFFMVTPSIESPRICFIGALIKVKGADLLPKILLQIRKAIKNAEMYIIGSGPLQPRSSIEGLHYVGHIPREKMSEILLKCSIYLHPARFDAFPASVVEAMAAGLIPIVTEMTGSRDIVKELDPNLIVPVDVNAIASKVIKILSLDVKEKKRLSERARRIVRTYSKLSQAEFVCALRTIILNLNRIECC